MPIDSAAFLAQAAALPEGSPPENVPHQAPLASDGWQELNRRIKLDSLSFLSSEPLPRLLLVRVVLSPLKDLIVEQHRLSAGWDDIQIHHEVRALAAGGLPAGRRDYRVLLAHDSLATRRCLQELSEIFVSERPWTLLPDDNDMSLSDMVLAGFRMLARAGAAVTQLLLARHRHYPYKMSRCCTAKLLRMSWPMKSGVCWMTGRFRGSLGTLLLSRCGATKPCCVCTQLPFCSAPTSAQLSANTPASGVT